MWAAGDPLGGAAHESKDLRLLLLLHFTPSQSNGNLLFYSLFPVFLYQGLALAKPQTARPFLREIKSAAKPHPESQGTPQSLTMQLRPGQTSPDADFRGPIGGAAWNRGYFRIVDNPTAIAQIGITGDIHTNE
jgi:hypothetical protein